VEYLKEENLIGFLRMLEIAYQVDISALRVDCHLGIARIVVVADVADNFDDEEFDL
jgi:hypothetical protein